ncbi:MAG: TnpV protein [Ruminococcus sp.]
MAQIKPKGVLKMTETISYTRQGDYLLPNITMPKQSEVTLGRYAQMRRKYLKEHHKIRYYNLLTQCKLTEHLADIQQRATEMEEMLITKMAAQEGLTEDLKAQDMMLWVSRMNNLKNRVQEIVTSEVIFS